MNKTRRDEIYDAYYDTVTYEWTEEVCGDPDCEYCKDRPEKHEHSGDDEQR